MPNIEALRRLRRIIERVPRSALDMRHAFKCAASYYFDHEYDPDEVDREFGFNENDARYLFGGNLCLHDPKPTKLAVVANIDRVLNGYPAQSYLEE